MFTPMKITINFNVNLGAESLLYKEVLKLATETGEVRQIVPYRGIIVYNVDYTAAFAFSAKASLLIAKHDWKAKVNNVSIYVMPHVSSAALNL